MVLSSADAKLASSSTMCGNSRNPVTLPAANSASAARENPNVSRRSRRVRPGETNPNSSKIQTGLDSTIPANRAIFSLSSNAPVTES